MRYSVRRRRLAIQGMAGRLLDAGSLDRLDWCGAHWKLSRRIESRHMLWTGEEETRAEGSLLYSTLAKYIERNAKVPYLWRGAASLSPPTKIQCFGERPRLGESVNVRSK